MGCPPKGRLRAYLDGELAPAAHEAVHRHVVGCERCQRVARQIAPDVTRRHLELLAPEGEPDMERAIVRSRALRQRGARTPIVERSLIMGDKVSKRPALAIGLVLILLAGLLSFGPGRALARQVLSVFRVRRFATVQINADPDRLEEVASQIEEALFVTDDPDVIQQPTRTRVATIEEASAAVGFEARMPTYWPNGGTPQIIVEGPSELALPFRGDGLRLLLELAGMDPAAIPPDLVEGEVRVASSGAVYLKAGSVSVSQVADITATYPDGIDVALMVEAGLRIAGLDPAYAQRLSQEYDWSNTALIPVVTSAVEVHETEIAGANALLVRAVAPKNPDESQSTLMMERDGILYIVSGPVTSSKLAQVAESMF